MANSVEIRCTKDGPNLIVVDGNIFAAIGGPCPCNKNCCLFKISTISNGRFHH